MKGFVFTTDALLAMTIAVVIVTSTHSMLSKAWEDYLAESQLTAFANDILIVLDKNETLDTLNEAKIENMMEEVLPDNYAAEIKIYSYEYEEAKGSFSLADNVIAKYPDMTVSDEFVRARRSFLTFNDIEGKMRIHRYNVAEIKLWLR